MYNKADKNIDSLNFMSKKIFVFGNYCNYLSKNKCVKVLCYYSCESFHNNIIRGGRIQSPSKIINLTIQLDLNKQNNHNHQPTSNANQTRQNMDPKTSRIQKLILWYSAPVSAFLVILLLGLSRLERFPPFSDAAT